MRAFLAFGYPDVGQKIKTYHPAIQAQVLQQLPQSARASYRLELVFFIGVWFLRLYWLLMVVWFFAIEQNTQLQILSTPLFLCSLAIVYSLGVVVRSGSVLHIFFAVVGTLTAGCMM